MSEIYKILLVDDHQMVMDGIKAMLRKQKKFKIIGEVFNGKQAIEFIDNNERPDFVLTDISMPEMNGIELTKYLKENHPEIHVLVLSMYNEPETTNEIVLAEAEGYILKNTGQKELLEALDRIAGGGTFYSNEVVQTMMKNYSQEKKQEVNVKILSEREIEILKLICDEKTTNEIAEELFISPRTVDTHRKNIAKKTGVKTIVGLIKFALVNQIVELN